MTEYQVVIVDKTGSRFGEFPDAAINRVSWTLNEAGTVDFSVPLRNPDTTKILLLQREVQIWRGGSLLWWGIPTHARADGNTLRVTCNELIWYFKRLYLGKPGRANLVFNPEFEQGTVGAVPTGWSLNGVSGSVSTAQHVLGERSVHLTSSLPDADFFLSQNISTPVAGATYYFAAECYIPPGTLVAPALDNRGFAAALFDGSNNLSDFQAMMVDQSTPQGQWVPIQFSVFVPGIANPSWHFEVRLYSPYSEIYWDAIYVAVDEQINYTNADMSSIATNLVSRAQTSPDYSDLNISTSGPPSGIITTISYKMTDHNNVFDIITDLTTQKNSRLGSIDVSIETPTPTSRIFTTWYPGKGSYKPNLVLEYGRNITKYDYELDGEQTANSIIVQGEGSGPTRMERGYVDASSLGGLILQELFSAPSGTPIDQLDALAYQEFTRSKNIVTILHITTSDPALVGTLKTGDTVPVRIDDNWTQVNGDYRITEIVLTPGTEEQQITLNLPNE